MTLETYEFIFKITGALLFILVGIIAFFLKNQYNTITELQNITADLKSVDKIRNVTCGSNHVLIESKINSVIDRVNEHEKRIQHLEQK